MVDSSRHKQCVGAGILDLGKLRVHVLRILIHALYKPKGYTVFLQYFAEFVGSTTTPIVVDDKEVGSS